MEQREQRLKELEARVSHLEHIAHPPVDWEKKIESLEGAYNRLYDLIRNNIGDK